MRFIVDGGSNIGLTVADYASLYPQARILGVELDPTSAAIANQVIAPFGDRCSIIQGAIWPTDGQIEYQTAEGQEHAAHVKDERDHGWVTATSPSYSLNTLLEGVDCVDFMKLDIEGGERDVLRQNTDWAAKVQAMLVEVHEPYSLAACQADLRALGFSTQRDRRHWAAVFGWR